MSASNLNEAEESSTPLYMTLYHNIANDSRNILQKTDNGSVQRNKYKSVGNVVHSSPKIDSVIPIINISQEPNVESGENSLGIDEFYLDSDVTIELLNSKIWKELYALDNEMLVNKSGRRMFPEVKVNVSGLKRDQFYEVHLDFIADSGRKFSYNKKRKSWGSGSDSCLVTVCSKPFVHPNSPAPGSFWNTNPITFCDVKLSNAEQDNSKIIHISGMHQYKCRVRLIPLESTDSTGHFKVFHETAFYAVTCYKNENLKMLKSHLNPRSLTSRSCSKVGPRKGTYESYVDEYGKDNPEFPRIGSSMSNRYRDMVTMGLPSFQTSFNDVPAGQSVLKCPKSKCGNHNLQNPFSGCFNGEAYETHSGGPSDSAPYQTTTDQATYTLNNGCEFDSEHDIGSTPIPGTPLSDRGYESFYSSTFDHEENHISNKGYASTPHYSMPKSHSNEVKSVLKPHGNVDNQNKLSLSNVSNYHTPNIHGLCGKKLTSDSYDLTGKIYLAPGHHGVLGKNIFTSDNQILAGSTNVSLGPHGLVGSNSLNSDPYEFVGSNNVNSDPYEFVGCNVGSDPHELAWNNGLNSSPHGYSQINNLSPHGYSQINNLTYDPHKCEQRNNLSFDAHEYSQNNNLTVYPNEFVGSSSVTVDPHEFAGSNNFTSDLYDSVGSSKVQSIDMSSMVTGADDSSWLSSDESGSISPPGPGLLPPQTCINSWYRFLTQSDPTVPLIDPFLPLSNE